MSCFKAAALLLHAFSRSGLGRDLLQLSVSDLSARMERTEHTVLLKPWIDK